MGEILIFKSEGLKACFMVLFSLSNLEGRARRFLFTMSETHPYRTLKFTYCHENNFWGTLINQMGHLVWHCPSPSMPAAFSYVWNTFSFLCDFCQSINWRLWLSGMQAGAQGENYNRYPCFFSSGYYLNLCGFFSSCYLRGIKGINGNWTFLGSQTPHRTFQP